MPQLATASGGQRGQLPPDAEQAGQDQAEGAEDLGRANELDELAEDGRLESRGREVEKKGR